MTWQLWQAFSHPPSAHPVFQRVLNGSDYHIEWVLLAQSIFIQGQIWFWSLVFILDTRLLVLMIFSGTFYGAVWALAISNSIAVERQQGMYDLLCLSPSGMIGVDWAIGTACLHRRAGFEHVNSQEAWSVRIILFVPLLVSAQLVLGRTMAATSAITVISALALLVFFYVDHIQSIILGVTFGLLGPHMVDSRFDARLRALSGFLLAQLSGYLLLAATAFLLLPAVYQRIGLRGAWADFSLPFFSLLIFVIVRDRLLYRLMRMLCDRLNAAPTEVVGLFQSAA
jgi:hypothetical protein